MPETARIRDVDVSLIRREGDAVRHADIFQDGRDLLRLRIQAKDIVPWLLLSLAVIRQAPRWIREPKRPVRLDGDIIRRVEALLFKAVTEDRALSVFLCAHDVPRAVPTGEQPPLSIK